MTTNATPLSAVKMTLVSSSLSSFGTLDSSLVILLLGVYVCYGAPLISANTTAAMHSPSHELLGSYSKVGPMDQQGVLGLSEGSL